MLEKTPSVSVNIDTLIVGQGLAGSLLAWRFLERGERILVVDRDEEITSSKVAAGLVTPLAGPRFSLPESLPERLLEAKRFYFEIEETTGIRCFHHQRIARLFRDEEEAETWRERLAADQERLAPYHGPLAIDGNFFHSGNGGFEMKEGGWLDVPVFLEATRQHLLERAAYAIGRVDSAEVVVAAGTDHPVRWKNVAARRVVFAEGWRGNQNRFFDWLTMRPSAGDILDLEIPELEEETRIVNQGGWLLPLGHGRFRAGSTYRHDELIEGPNSAGRIEVLRKLDGITPIEPRVVGHRAAIRPSIHRSQIVMGRHPAHDCVVFFNGLGSKGVLNGPWHADRLVAHLLGDAPLPDEADLRANFIGS